MTLMCMMCPDPSLDKVKMAMIAVCHDVAEALVGDISPAMNVAKEEKYRLEKEAILLIENILGKSTSPDAGAFIRDNWLAYESQATPEARFVRDMDLLEMIMQAHTYEKTESHLDKGRLDSFFASAAKLTHPWSKEIAARLIETRPT